MAEIGSYQFSMPFGCDETQTIDGKNRLLIPKQDRDNLGKDFVAAQTAVGCIGLYRLSDWMQIVMYARGFDKMNEGRETYTRLMFTGVKYGLNFDPQGRVVIPPDLLARGDIDKTVRLLGCDDRIELWNPDEYKNWKSDTKGYNRERRDEIKAAYEEMVAGGRPKLDV